MSFSPTLLGESCVQLFKTSFLQQKKKKNQKIIPHFCFALIRYLSMYCACTSIEFTLEKRPFRSLKVHSEAVQCMHEIVPRILLSSFLRGLGSNYLQSPVVYIVLTVDEASEPCDNYCGPTRTEDVRNECSSARYQTHHPTATPFIEIFRRANMVMFTFGA